MPLPNLDRMLRECQEKHIAHIVRVNKCNLSLGTKHGSNNVWVFNVEVDPRYRGQGLAKSALLALISAADRQAITLNLEAVPLDDATDIRKLVGFYESFGFKLLKNKNNFALMKREPWKKTMSIDNVSQRLAVAGIAHVIVGTDDAAKTLKKLVTLRRVIDDANTAVNSGRIGDKTFKAKLLGAIKALS